MKATHLSMLVALTMGGTLLTEAEARPLIGKKDAPGAVRRWEQSGRRLVLHVSEGTEAQDVEEALLAASAIRQAGARILARGDRVVVIAPKGTDMDQLFAELRTLDVVGDDVDAVLASLSAPTEGEDGSGSSIRAGKATRLADADDKKSAPIGTLQGTVLKVERRRFPIALITVKLEAGSAPGLALGQSVVILPRVRSRRGLIDPRDRKSQANLGGWFLLPGDALKFSLDPQRRRSPRIAESLERLTDKDQRGG